MTKLKCWKKSGKNAWKKESGKYPPMISIQPDKEYNQPKGKYEDVYSATRSHFSNMGSRTEARNIFKMSCQSSSIIDLTRAG